MNSYLLTSICSCTLNREDKNQNGYQKTNDSIAILLSMGLRHNDSVALSKALSLSDSALIFVTETEQLQKLFYMRSSIYMLLGKEAKSLHEQEKAILLLPPEHIDRLLFYGRKYKRSGVKDSASFYFNKALAKCKKQLEEDYDENYLAKEIEALVNLGETDFAMEILNGVLEKKPTDSFVKALKEALANQKVENHGDRF